MVKTVIRKIKFVYGSEVEITMFAGGDVPYYRVSKKLKGQSRVVFKYQRFGIAESKMCELIGIALLTVRGIKFSDGSVVELTMNEDGYCVIGNGEVFSYKKLKVAEKKLDELVGKAVLAGASTVEVEINSFLKGESE